MSKINSIRKRVWLICHLNILGMKKKDVNSNYVKLGVSQNKSKKPQDVIEVKKSDTNVGRKPYVFKKRIIRQSEKQHNERSENNNRVSYNAGFNINISVKHNKNNTGKKNDHEKSRRSNQQYKHQKYNEQSEKNPIGASNYIVNNDSYNTDEFSSKPSIKSQDITEKTLNNVKLNADIETINVNCQGATFSKSKVANDFDTIFEQKVHPLGGKCFMFLNYN